MFTKEDLLQLVNTKGRDAVAAAVEKIPEEEVRHALMLLVVHHQKSMEIEKQLREEKHEQYQALERELEAAKEQIRELGLSSH